MLRAAAGRDGVPDSVPGWPKSEHTIFTDRAGSVYIGGVDRTVACEWCFEAALACSGVSGAPGSLKMGNTPSPWRYDDAAGDALQLANSATGCDLALRLMASCLPDFGERSGYPSIPDLSINCPIDVMCQGTKPFVVTS
jgi:hypothetical protein